MYTINFEKYASKDEFFNVSSRPKPGSELEAFFEYSKSLFLKSFDYAEDKLTLQRNMNIYADERNIIINSYYQKKMSLLELGKLAAAGDPAAQKRGEIFSFSMRFSKNYSKFPTSKIYGFKENLEQAPNILLSKEKFKESYKSDLIPEYNYSIDITGNGTESLHKKYNIVYEEKISPIANFCIDEIINIFSKYGEVTERKRKNKYLDGENNTIRSFFIKNTICFNFEIHQTKEYRINKAGNISPCLKITCKLDQSELTSKQIRKKDGTFESKEYYIPYMGKNCKHFSVEVREFDFLKTPNYYAISMTPHGYLRLKKTYSKDFFKKIIFHYQFKKYFEKYEVEMNFEELEEDPQAFFDLVSMLQF